MTDWQHDSVRPRAFNHVAAKHVAVIRRLLCLLLAACVLVGCIAPPMRTSLRPPRPPETDGTFVMQDGTVLPYRDWLPEGQPQAVILALHGMNDSRDAWEYPAPAFTAANMAVFAPDLSGFGATATRGAWPGVARMTDETRQMVALLRHRFPHTKLILMAESMGAAELMVLATQPHAPQVDGYVLIAPAVWGRKEMSFLMRATLWLAENTVPGMTLTGRGFIKVTASDNREALIRLGNDPLTIHATKVDAVKGLVDLMDQALAAAPRFKEKSLFLYGGHDELVPPRATAAVWEKLPPGDVRAFYPNGYHLLLRDMHRDAPINDIISWIQNPAEPLPSGAEAAAASWLAREGKGSKRPD